MTAILTYYETVYIQFAKFWCLYVSSAVGVARSIDPQVPSLNAAGNFVFKNSGKILILVFSPKIEIFSVIFNSNTLLEIISLSNSEVQASMQNFSQRCGGPFSGPCVLYKR